MPLINFDFLVVAQLLLIGYGIFWVLRRNDELPFMISCLLFYVVSYRYWAVQSGQADWVNLSDYANLQPASASTALDAAQYILLGQICLILAYSRYQRSTIPRGQNDPRLTPVLEWLRPRLTIVGLGSILLVYWLRQQVSQQVSAGQAIAFQISGYLYLFPLLLISIATLVLLIWRFGGMRSPVFKLIAIGILIQIGQLTWTVSGRFQFLGWIITSGIIISSFYKPKTRLLILGSCGFLGTTLFAIAGALRGSAENLTLGDAALTRWLAAEDANMLDGFVYLKQAFPAIVPFRLGMAHVEILLRPIPRSLWPDKPVGGGYLEAIGLVNPETGFTLGFSPTIFGDFYSEGGVLAIIILATLYGILMATAVRWTLKLHPFLGVLVRAIILATLVPLLRGGDLAGIWAWIGMAFWPCFLMVWLIQKRLKKLPFYGFPGQYVVVVNKNATQGRMPPPRY
jgi:hypothetical protein